MKLGLGTGFKTQVELPAVRDNLFNNRLHLVHLDGIDHVILAFVVVFLSSLFETTPCLFDTVVKNVGETEQYRWCDIADSKLIHHFAQVDLRTVLARGNVDITFLVDAEIGSAPSVDVIELLRIFNRPFLHKQS